MKNFFCTFDGHDIRIVLKDGEPWFVLQDVCNALGIVNSRNVATRLDEDEKGVTFLDTLGGKQEVAIVNESGLYVVVIRSNKPEAKVFRKWVTSEVLPSIRKNGYYVTKEAIGAGAEPKRTSHQLSAERVKQISDEAAAHVWKKEVREYIDDISQVYDISDGAIFSFLYKHLERELEIDLNKMVQEKVIEMRARGAKPKEILRVNRFRVVCENSLLRDVFSQLLCAMTTLLDQNQGQKVVLA